MCTKILGLFLPMAFILHNVEECRSFEEFKIFYLKKISPKLCHRIVFLYALIILTLLVSGICIANYWTASRALECATTIIAISLFVNAVQHIVSSYLARKMIPGTISAILLLIPCSLVYLFVLERETRFSIFDIVTWGIISIILTPLSIRLSLWIGYLLFKRSR